MILFPAMLLGGHLVIAVVDQVPNLDFEPLCRDAANESLGVGDSFKRCIDDEGAARDALAKQWNEFEAADRARCVRTSMADRTASYVEILTCLELQRDANKMRQKGNAAIDAPGAR
jgi:hypothetical protein